MLLVVKLRDFVIIWDVQNIGEKLSIHEIKTRRKSKILRFSPCLF